MRTSAKQVLDFCAPHRERDQGNTWSQNLLNCESRKKEKVGAFRSARKSRTLPFSAFFMAEQRISRELFHRVRGGGVDGKQEPPPKHTGAFSRKGFSKRGTKPLHTWKRSRCRPSRRKGKRETPTRPNRRAPDRDDEMEPAVGLAVGRLHLAALAFPHRLSRARISATKSQCERPSSRGGPLRKPCPRFPYHARKILSTQGQ